MCTRYYVELSPELRPYIEAASRSRLKESMVTKLGRAFKFSGEIRPTDIAAVIAPGPGGEKSVYPMVWGYHVPGIDHPIVNARLESVGEKKTFSVDWRKHRCIIPASYYFDGSISGSRMGANRPAAGMPFSLPDPMSPIWQGCTGLKRGKNSDIRYLRFLPESRRRN